MAALAVGTVNSEDVRTDGLLHYAGGKVANRTTLAEQPTPVSGLMPLVEE